jgi:molybdopterin-containing oxidoreductase family membrane subunit
MRDELILPGEDIASMNQRVMAVPLGARIGRWWLMAMITAAALVMLLTVAIGWLFLKGTGIWGLDYPVAWGFAIINYVWWIGIASGGTFISAFFFLMQVKWRSALNRVAETMTVFAACCAGIYPILHLGRPWFFYWLLPYPDTMGLWPQFRSPLLWDFYAILTYVIGSVLFWYLGLVPDLAALRDAARTPVRRFVYELTSLGFRGSARQWGAYRASYGVLAAVMAPLVVSVHSIVGLDFAGGETPGWHSTQFPPFFVFGAVLSGFAMVLMLIIPLRRLLRLEPFITERHLDILGRLLLTSSLCVAYAYTMEAFSVFYGGDAAEQSQFIDKLTGLYWPVYWGTLLFNVAAPQFFWLRSFRLNQSLVMVVSFLVVVGMWLERFSIVVTSLDRTDLPSSWGNYIPTFWDWATLFGTIGLFCAGLLVCVRFLPTLSMFEMRELLAEKEERA